MHRTTLRSLILGSLAAFAVASMAASPALAQIDFGVRGGVYTDIEEPFVGVELLTRVGDTQWFFNPNAEFVLVDDGDLATANFDFHYDLPVEAPIYVWLGGGPAVVFSDPPARRADSETDAGFNFLGGVGWDVEPLVLYVQGKILVSDDSEAVAAFGVRF